MHIYEIKKGSLALLAEIGQDYKYLVASQMDMQYLFGVQGNQIEVLTQGITGAGTVKTFDTGYTITAIKTFLLGGTTHLVCYDGQALYFYSVSKAGDIELLSSYKRTYGIVTEGYTTIEPYYYRESMYLLCYNGVTGDAQTYQLSVTATDKLSATLIWQKGWAKGWTRFALFKLGGENFFLKTNTIKKQVNVDHFVDNAEEGSHPVNTELMLPMDLTAVATCFTEGYAGFASYRSSDGILGLYRYHSDCASWDTILETTAILGKNGICIVPREQETLLIVH